MNNLRKILLLLIVGCGCSLWTEQQADAQPIKRILRQMDADQNGYINPHDEMTPQLASLVRRYGFDPGEYVEINSLISTIDQTNAGMSPTAITGMRKVPGFGNGNDGDTIDTPGFGTADENEMSDEDLVATYSESVMEQVTSVLSRYDGDGNGIISELERREGNWRNPPFEKSDLNHDGALSKTELAKRYFAREEAANENGSSEGGGRNEEEDDGRRGRNTRRDRDQSESSNTSSRSTQNRASAVDSIARAQRYVDGLFERYDKNSDGSIDENEMKEMRRPPEGADSDGDGQLSREEVLGFANNQGGAEQNSSEQNSSQQNADRSDEDNGRSRRQRSGSFSDYDTNEDGQIQMNEYSETWDGEIFQQFQTRDSNNDGIITPEEWSSTG